MEIKLEKAKKICERRINELKLNYVITNEDLYAIETILQELEKFMKKDNYYEDIQEAYNNLIKNSIPKDTIEDKIEKLIKQADYRTNNNPNGRIHFLKEKCDYQIEILEELLEGK